MMALSGSLQASTDVGFCKNYGTSNQFKYMAGRGRLRLNEISLSSHGSRLDALSLGLSKNVHMPLCCAPPRFNVFKCHSFLIPGQSNEVPVLKTAVTAVTRSYNLYRGSPLVVQLVSAVSIISFAVWGLGPLMRHGRNFFLRRSDNSWKKSSTHYVMTSYIQPLLLWTGAALVCRALDPVVLPSEASQVVKQRLLSFSRSLSTVLAFAYCLSSLIQQTQKFLMEHNDTNDTRNMGFQFAGKAVYTAVWVAAVSLFMELLGFSTQKWLTAGGLGTVLLTLAGREIFTNFLSSAMIHATRPFIVNEWIQTKIEGYEVSGTVEHVGWWSPTIIRGEDREAVHIPNHKFTVNVVRNLSQKTHWRIKTHLAISHLDVSKINSIVADMRKVLAKSPQVEQQRLHRRVFLDNVNPENQALLILISCFVKTSHHEEYLCVKEAILLDLLRVVSHHRARLATPIRTVQKVYSDADMDNIPFAEAMYSRPRAANNRPYLLIEPSYKINGEDKSKSQPRPARKSEESSSPDAKVGKTDAKPVESSLTSTNPKAMARSGSDDAGPKKDKRVEKAGSGDSVPKKTVAPTPVKSEQNVIDQGGLNSKESEKLASAGASPPPTPRSALDDNIVLGVALEGSKRTLPIEEEEMAPLTAAEEKELAAIGNGSSSSSSPSTGKDSTKDGQGSGSQRPRDQER
ncbi:hypothetical protein ACHQM5_011201 [Ranunculus cassubicifolius]